MNIWIDTNYDAELNVGDVGYLVSSDNSNTRAWDVLTLHSTPLRTNRSHEERLTGWCGETDNVSRTAKGAWRVVKLNKKGDRMMIRQIHRGDLCTFLANDGRPNLIPDALAPAWNRGIDAGSEHVDVVLAEQGVDAVLASLQLGQPAWDEAAINARAHATHGIPDELADIYYAAYALGAKDRAEEIRDEQKTAKAA
jgi:hypothetical protein